MHTFSMAESKLPYGANVVCCSRFFFFTAIVLLPVSSSTLVDRRDRFLQCTHLIGMNDRMATNTFFEHSSVFRIFLYNDVVYQKKLWLDLVNELFQFQPALSWLLKKSTFAFSSLHECFSIWKVSLMSLIWKKWQCFPTTALSCVGRNYSYP